MSLVANDTAVLAPMAKDSTFLGNCGQYLLNHLNAVRHRILTDENNFLKLIKSPYGAGDAHCGLFINQGLYRQHWLYCYHCTQLAQLPSPNIRLVSRARHQ